jgi:hypothetical protein
MTDSIERSVGGPCIHPPAFVVAYVAECGDNRVGAFEWARPDSNR